MGWPAPMVARFHKLFFWTPTVSYTDIAEKLSKEFGIPVTKNACVGYANRNGMKRQGRALDRPRARKGRPAKPRLAGPQKVPHTTPLLDLAFGDCRWTDSNAHPFLFCGMPQIPSCSYCLEHARRSYPAMARSA